MENGSQSLSVDDEEPLKVYHSVGNATKTENEHLETNKSFQGRGTPGARSRSKKRYLW